MDLLAILASIATSLVGFTGLLTAFRASTDSLGPNDITNIRILVIFSVSALVFALLPIPMSALAGHDQWMRWLTIVLGLYFLLWTIQSPRWMRRKQVKPRSPAIYWTMLATQGLAGILLLFGGWSSGQPIALYLIGVTWLLVTAIVVFVVQIFAMLPVSRPD